MEGAEWEKQERVQRGLMSLRAILLNEDGYRPDHLKPKLGIQPKELVPVLVAILFSASERRYQNLYELRAANKMLRKSQLQQNARDVTEEIHQYLTGEGAKELDKTKTLKLAARLILYHKMADRVVFDRLAIHVYEKIKSAIESKECEGTPLQMGLVAASNYNSSGELNEKTVAKERIRAVLEAWTRNYPANSDDYLKQRGVLSDDPTCSGCLEARTASNSSTQCKRGTEDPIYTYCHYDVLWDYPLCDVCEEDKRSDKFHSQDADPVWARRYQLNPEAFEGFVSWMEDARKALRQQLHGTLKEHALDEWWYQRENGFFVTINYAQSRFLLQPQFRDLLKQGRSSSIYDHAHPEPDFLDVAKLELENGQVEDGSASTLS